MKIKKIKKKKKKKKKKYIVLKQIENVPYKLSLGHFRSRQSVT